VQSGGDANDKCAGYYAYNFRSIGGLQTLFGQLWKEYALSDSRYLTQDPFVLCMESITAVGWMRKYRDQ